MPNLLMLASGVGLVAATAALWVQGGRRADHLFFAGLTSIAVTLSLFSLVAWAATAHRGCKGDGFEPSVPRYVLLQIDDLDPIRLLAHRVMSQASFDRRPATISGSSARA